MADESDIDPWRWPHGVVSRRELLAAGLTPSAIAERLENGRLHRRYRGVYPIGRPDLGPLGERRAVVLACGPGAVLSHRSAASAWGLRPSSGPRFDVTVPTARRPAAPVRLHRNVLGDDEVVLVDAIPTTTVARTLCDLAVVVPGHHLRRAVERADELGLFHLEDLERALARRRQRPGAPAMRALLADFAAHGETRTRSDLEALFLQLCLDHGLPRPQVNRYDNGTEVDFRWPAARLIVETDGFSTHRSRHAFERDRRKRLRLEALGWHVISLSWRQVRDDASTVAAVIRARLTPTA
jgi:very-short-patch-repair endonuclease